MTTVAFVGFPKQKSMKRVKSNFKCWWQEEGKKGVKIKKKYMDENVHERKVWEHRGGKCDRKRHGVKEKTIRKRDWRNRAVEGERTARESRVGVVASALDCYWFSVSLRVHQLFLSISFTSPSLSHPSPLDLLKHPPSTSSSSSSHSPSLHHIPPCHRSIFLCARLPLSHIFLLLYHTTSTFPVLVLSPHLCNLC